MAARTSRTDADPIRSLEEDHRAVEAIFERIQKARGADARAKAFHDLEAALTLHATLEEGIFYPAVASLPDVEALDRVAEAVEAHGAVKGLLAEIAATSPRAPGFLAKCEALRIVVSGHVEEEEGDTFPRARKLLGSDRLAALGRRMASVRRARESAERELRAAARDE